MVLHTPRKKKTEKKGKNIYWHLPRARLLSPRRETGAVKENPHFRFQETSNCHYCQVHKRGPITYPLAEFIISVVQTGC